jgi:hypothetical protein
VERAATCLIVHLYLLTRHSIFVHRLDLVEGNNILSFSLVVLFVCFTFGIGVSVFLSIILVAVCALFALERAQLSQVGLVKSVLTEGVHETLQALLVHTVVFIILVYILVLILVLPDILIVLLVASQAVLDRRW